MLDLKHEALESISIGVGGIKVATIWYKIAGAFALCNEPMIRPYADYSSEMQDEDPFDTVDPSPTIGRPLGYELGAAPDISQWTTSRQPFIKCKLACLP